MFSVVIPLYNKEKYISETLQSVLDQVEDDFEIIVVNDGSTDQSLQIVETFSDDRITVFSIPHSGVSVARNTGISKASREWICFLDADDWWDVNFLTEIKQAIHRHQGYDVFASGRTRIFSTKKDRYQNPIIAKDGETSAVSYFEVISKDLPPLNSSNAVIRKSVFFEQVFNVAMRQHEDHDLWLRICATRLVVFVNKPLSFYRKGVTGSASALQLRASDFNTYIDTIGAVKPKLTVADQNFFRIYYKRFIVISFIQNYGHYSKSNRKDLLKKIKILIPISSYFVLTLLHYTSFINSYQWYQKMKM